VVPTNESDMVEAMMPFPTVEETKLPHEARQALTPPTSEEWNKHDDNSSELSEQEDEEDNIGDIEPDHYYEGGRIPVFMPVSHSFWQFTCAFTSKELLY